MCYTHCRADFLGGERKCVVVTQEPVSPDTLTPTHSLTSSQAMILCPHTLA